MNLYMDMGLGRWSYETWDLSRHVGKRCSIVRSLTSSLTCLLRCQGPGVESLRRQSCGSSHHPSAAPLWHFNCGHTDGAFSEHGKHRHGSSPDLWWWIKRMFDGAANVTRIHLQVSPSQTCYNCHYCLSPVYAAVMITEQHRGANCCCL